MSDLDLKIPAVMGILNLTPDSFSDGGRFTTHDAALEQARRMAAEGAQWLDLGGESTRPGALAVSADEELERVMPVLEAVRAELPVKLSLDTSKPEVMRAGLAAGVDMINDVNALRAEGALQAVADSRAMVCLMHMQGAPRTMQDNPHYQDVVSEVAAFLGQRLTACEAAGIERARIFLDPGFGFGKTVQHNLLLMRHLRRFQEPGCGGVLVGVSRKSMLGAILDKPVDERLYGGLALAALAVEYGAALIRTHDVAPTVDVVKTAWAVAGVDQQNNF